MEALEALTNILNYINGIVWGAPMLALILLTGLFLQIGLTFLPLRKISYGFSLLW